MLGLLLAPGVFHQDPPHGLRCGSKEMATRIPVLGLLHVDQPNVRLMDQSRGLEGLTGLFLGKALRGELSQCVITPGARAVRPRPGRTVSICPRICVTLVVGMAYLVGGPTPTIIAAQRCSLLIPKPTVEGWSNYRPTRAPQKGSFSGSSWIDFVPYRAFARLRRPQLDALVIPVASNSRRECQIGSFLGAGQKPVRGRVLGRPTSSAGDGAGAEPVEPVRESARVVGFSRAAAVGRWRPWRRASGWA